MEVKIPFYNLVNMLLTGIVFIGGISLFLPELVMDIINNPIISRTDTCTELTKIIFIFAFAYETGLIINRIGSILIEPLLKKLKFIPFNDNYVKFNIKQKKYPIMHTLSREYALSRTRITMFILLTIISLFSIHKLFAILLVIVTLIYFASYRKHAKKIVDLMNESEDNNGNNE